MSDRNDSIDWTFAGNWPFEPSWFESDDGRMHYVDVGPRGGTPVVMVHGNPTWGYLYRRFISAVVAQGHRAIVMDHLGFGRSDKPDDPALYTIERHVQRCSALLESLELQDAICVVQDWGGPIGLGWAANHADRIAQLFILNTYFHRPTSKVPLPLPLRLFRTPGIGELMVKGLHAFVRVFLFKAGLANPEVLTDTDKRAYLAPHPNWSSRTGILEFPRQIPADGSDPLNDLLEPWRQQLVTAFRDKPVFIAWPRLDVA
ncbi:MAG: alpha/beta fold hydrolase, partial [Pseudomonadota bacterium]